MSDNYKNFDGYANRNVAEARSKATSSTTEPTVFDIAAKMVEEDLRPAAAIMQGGATATIECQGGSAGCPTCHGAKVVGTPGMPCPFCPPDLQGSATSGEAEFKLSDEAVETWMNGIGGGVWANGKLTLREDELKSVIRGIAALTVKRYKAAVPALATSTDDEYSSREAAVLRRLLAWRVSGGLLYADDGELQDNTAWPHIDFKRDKVDTIEIKLGERTQAELAASARAPVAEQSNTPVPRVGGNTCDLTNYDSACNYSNGTAAEVLRAAAPASVPIYMVRGTRGGWVDADLTMYDNAADWNRRILYDAPEVAQPAAQGESIDTPEFRKLSYAYAEAVMRGTIPQTSAAWEALVDFCNARGARQRRAGQLDMSETVETWGEGQRQAGERSADAALVAENRALVEKLQARDAWRDRVQSLVDTYFGNNVGENFYNKMEYARQALATPILAPGSAVQAEAASALENVGIQLFYCRQRLAADSPLQPGLARAAEIVKQMKEQK